MSNLPKFITFTGADDRTSIYAMAALFWMTVDNLWLKKLNELAQRRE